MTKHEEHRTLDRGDIVIAISKADGVDARFIASEVDVVDVNLELLREDVDRLDQISSSCTEVNLRNAAWNVVDQLRDLFVWVENAQEPPVRGAEEEVAPVATDPEERAAPVRKTPRIRVEKTVEELKKGDELVARQPGRADLKVIRKADRGKSLLVVATSGRTTGRRRIVPNDLRKLSKNYYLPTEPV